MQLDRAATSVAPSELLKKYQEALVHAGMGFWEVDIATKYVTWDEGHRVLYEKGEGQYQGRLDDFWEITHEDDRDNLKNFFTQILTENIDINFLFRIYSKKQDIKYIRVSGYRVKKNGQLTSLIGISSDVTSKSLLQMELKKAKEFTDNILNAIPDPIFVKNDRHEIIYANSEYENLIGKKKDVFIGKNDFAYLPKEVADICWQADSKVFQENAASESEEVFVDTLRRARNILTKKTPLNLRTTTNLDSEEKILVGVIRDITHLKDVQHKLIEQSKMASLGEMAAEIAHEINNPLMIIQGKAQLLQAKIDTKQISWDTCQKDLRQIETNCIRIDKIIKSLKSLARKVDHDPFENISIRKIIDDAFEISKERFKTNKFDLFVFTEDGIDYSYLTRARVAEIVQVLVSLLNNSYDAIQNQEQGWARLSLSHSVDTFHIEVTDSGAEITTEVAKKMMEPFFTTKPTGKGVGLGLSIAKQVIQNHNGELYYDRKDNNTRFTFTLPRV